MSVSILIVDDEPDVAELFRQHFRHEVRQGLYVLHFAIPPRTRCKCSPTGSGPSSS